MSNFRESKNIDAQSAQISHGFKKFNKAIDEIENLLGNFKSQKGENMNNNSFTKSFNNEVKSVDQYENSERKSLIKYLMKGEQSLDEKSMLLSKDKENSGYLLPSYSIDQINKIMKYLCPLRSLAKTVQISGNVLDILVDTQSTEVGWVISKEMENAKLQELTKIQIPVHQMYARPKTSQKILDDTSEDLEYWIVSKIAQKMACLENNAFLHGNGENQPKGILKYPMVKVGEGSWGKVECVEQLSNKSEIERQSLLDVVNSLQVQYLHNAVWLISRSALNSIQNIKDEQGRFLWQQSLTTGTHSMLLGYPVLVSDDMPSISNGESIPVLFGNFEDAYQIVDRGDVSVLRDPYSAKPFIEFFITKRTGGDVVDFNAIKALKIISVH